MPAPVCESCGHAPAVRAVTLGAAEPFLICRGCDLIALEAERRPVRPHRTPAGRAPALLGSDTTADRHARRLVLATI